MNLKLIALLLDKILLKCKKQKYKNDFVYTGNGILERSKHLEPIDVKLNKKYFKRLEKQSKKFYR